jgi:hypothetical protein
MVSLVWFCEKICLLENRDATMKNMCPKSSEWLASVGIHTIRKKLHPFSFHFWLDAIR